MAPASNCSTQEAEEGKLGVWEHPRLPSLPTSKTKPNRKQEDYVMNVLLPDNRIVLDVWPGLSNKHRHSCKKQLRNLVFISGSRGHSHQQVICSQECKKEQAWEVTPWPLVCWGRLAVWTESTPRCCRQCSRLGSWSRWLQDWALSSCRSRDLSHTRCSWASILDLDNSPQATFQVT